MVAWCWVDNFWKFLQQKRCTGVAKLGACSVQLLSLCKRGFFFNWCMEVSGFFWPFSFRFCIMLQSFGKSWVSVKHHCLHQSPVQSCVHIVQPHSLCAAADPCTILAAHRPRGSATRNDWAEPQMPTGLARVKMSLGINRCTTAFGGWGAHLVKSYLLWELHFL